jgi:HPr kinase/phosphorylase
VFGVGVLIEGKSGVGKSETALELVKKGHMFVADDAVDITNVSGKILAKPNPVAGRFIEIRGLGILNVSQMFGIEKTAPTSNIDVIVEMIKEEGSDINFERVGNVNKTKTLEKVKIPYYSLPITPGRKMSDLIEAAVIDFKLKRHGYNSARDYISNFNKINRKKNKQ